jgi:hypothetical protein
MYAAINPGTQVNSAQRSLAQPSISRHLCANQLARIAAWTILGAALSGCRPPHDHSQGVELVTSTDTPTPAMTFELRFEPAMVREGEVGPAATNPPMVITPPACRDVHLAQHTQRGIRADGAASFGPAL